MAERYFPVRVRIGAPACGIGSQLNAMHGWLDAEFGCDSYWVGADVGPGREAALFYFLDVVTGKAFGDRFAIARRIVPSGRPEDRPF